MSVSSAKGSAALENARRVVTSVNTIVVMNTRTRVDPNASPTARVSGCTRTSGARTLSLRGVYLYNEGRDGDSRGRTARLDRGGRKPAQESGRESQSSVSTAAQRTSA